MIIIKSPREIDLMREPCKVTAEILHKLKEFIEPGKTTQDINDFIAKIINEHNMTPTFLGYNGFPGAACVSVNEEIVHGIPSASRKLRDGDIVSVDMGATYQGYCSDAARTYPVGNISAEARELIEVTEESFWQGVKYAMPGYRIHDIGHAIQEYAESHGFGIIRDYLGHGTGKFLHEDPQIPNYGKAGTGPKIQAGMTLAIEPMLSLGDYSTRVLSNDWTVVTKDGSLSGHYENTVLVTDGEPEILTV